MLSKLFDKMENERIEKQSNALIKSTYAMADLLNGKSKGRIKTSIDKINTISDVKNDLPVDSHIWSDLDCIVVYNGKQFIIKDR
jgi:uncharacterized protein YjfI (DUF2170 family)